ncbi:MAG: nucleotidyltransferase family protein [Alphaproteobacteria bacterium]|nr:nucleotidyltransferase family protein [Alphaproteobacteria bacterium]
MAIGAPETASKGIDFLCAIAGPQRDLERARHLLPGVLDFSAILDFASEHYLGPQLLSALSDLDWQGVPAESKAKLEDFRRQHVLRTLHLTEELCRIAALFPSRGITFAAFKGAALAVDLYGDPARRVYSDIDIIVPSGQVPAAEMALESLGYHNDQGDRAFRQMFCAYQGQYSFVHADRGVAVDLHWVFTAAALPFPLQVDDLWSGLRSLTVGTCTIPTFSDPDVALLLAGHGTKEGWRSLGWICDFATFVHQRPALDWPGLHRRACRQGSGDAVLLAFALSNMLLGVAIPTGFADKLAKNRRVARLAAGIIDGLRGGASKRGRSHLMDLALCDRLWDRIRAAARLTLTPTPGDYQALPLPRVSWPLYYVLRPLRLAARGLASLRGDRQPMIGQ